MNRSGLSCGHLASRKYTQPFPPARSSLLPLAFGRRRDLDQLPKSEERSFADPADVHELLDLFEPAVLFAVGDDELRGTGTDTGQGLERLLIGGIEIDSVGTRRGVLSAFRLGLCRDRGVRQAGCENDSKVAVIAR